MNNAFLYLQIIAYAVVIITILFVFILLLIKEFKKKAIEKNRINS